MISCVYRSRCPVTGSVGFGGPSSPVWLFAKVTAVTIAATADSVNDMICVENEISP